MAKHRRKWDADVYRRYIREGRGQGSGAGYKPWIAIQDFASLGMVSRIKGKTTGRVHHLMSNHEVGLFYLLDWSERVTDIREQYPLADLSKAIGIAEGAGIRYPFDPKSGFPYVLTSDFLIETLSGTEAIAVKQSSELANLRVREKLEIERRYWLGQGVKWRIITEREINQPKARNIEWLATASDLADFGLNANLQIECVAFFMAGYHLRLTALKRFFLEVEREFGLDAGMGLTVYKHLVYHKRIRTDITAPISGMTMANIGG